MLFYILVYLNYYNAFMHLSQLLQAALLDNLNSVFFMKYILCKSYLLTYPLWLKLWRMFWLSALIIKIGIRWT